VFGVGAQEMVIIVVLLLIIFGPAKLGHMARDLGRVAYKARASMEEFKEEFSVEKYSDQDYEEPRRSHGENGPEAPDRHSPRHSPPKTAQTPLAADEGSTDSSLLRSPVKDKAVGESSQTAPPLGDSASRG
jgi:Sec-independent protein translocase protein TatA